MSAKSYVINERGPVGRDVQGNVSVERSGMFASVYLYGHEIISWARGCDEFTLRVVFGGTGYNTRTTVRALNRGLEQLGIPGKVTINHGLASYQCDSLNIWPIYIGKGLTIKQNGEVVK